MANPAKQNSADLDGGGVAAEVCGDGLGVAEDGHAGVVGRSFFECLRTNGNGKGNPQ